MAPRPRPVAEAQPNDGRYIQPHDSLLAAGFELFGSAAAGDQPQLGALAALRAGQALQQPARLLQRPHQEQPAQAPAIHYQGERQLQLTAFAGKPLQAEQFSYLVVRMAAVTEAVQASFLGGSQAGRAPRQAALFHHRPCFTTDRQRLRI